MKRWLKIFLIVFAVLVIGGAGAFLYVDYKITQTMVNMAKKQDQMKVKKDTLTVDNEDIPAGSSNKGKSQSEESSLHNDSELTHSEIDDQESETPGSKSDETKVDERASSKDSNDESKKGSRPLPLKIRAVEIISPLKLRRVKHQPVNQWKSNHMEVNQIMRHLKIR